MAYESKFTVHVTGETSSETFDGLFVVKTKLSFSDQLRRDEVRRQLLGETPAGTTPLARALDAAMMFSELSVRVLDAPKWWTSASNGLGLCDDNVLNTVFEKAMKAELDDAAAVKKAGDQAKTDLQAAVPKE